MQPKSTIPHTPNPRPSSRGFTLIEMLIAISIFIVFIGLSSQSYVGLVSANRKANEAQKTYREVRQVFDAISSEAKNSLIDFACINPNAGSDFAQNYGVSISDAACVDNSNVQNSPEAGIPVLAFVRKLDSENLSRTLYRFHDKKIERLDQKRTNLALNWETVSVGPSGSNWIPITSSAVDFESAVFDVFPRKNPYDREYVDEIDAQWQPSVNIKIKIPHQDVIYETTYSSRSYGTRSLYSVVLPEDASQ